MEIVVKLNKFDIENIIEEYMTNNKSMNIIGKPFLRENATRDIIYTFEI